MKPWDVNKYRFPTNYQSEQLQVVGTLEKHICDHCDCFINTAIDQFEKNIYMNGLVWSSCAVMVIAS